MQPGVGSATIGVGLLGYGTVGSAVDRMLRARDDDVERVTGRRVEVVRALVRSTSAERPSSPVPGVLTARFEDVRDDARVAVVAEVMGGIEPARSYILELLER